MWRGLWAIVFVLSPAREMAEQLAANFFWKNACPFRTMISLIAPNASLEILVRSWKC